MRTRLVELARGGDDVAFADLVDLDGDLCYRIAFRILRDAERAQDAVQQAFLVAWRELPRLASTCSAPSGVCHMCSWWRYEIINSALLVTSVGCESTGTGSA